MFVFSVCVSCVSSCIFDEPIIRSEDSDGVCLCLIVCDLETSTMRQPRPELGCIATKIIFIHLFTHNNMT